MTDRNDPPIDGELPIPPRERSTIRADSVAEEYSYLGAWPAASGAWRIEQQTLFVGPLGPEDHLSVRAPGGEAGMLRIAIGSFYGSEYLGFARPGAAVDDVMKVALDWTADNEPAHVGALPRFPVPAVGYPGRVAVPFAVRAVDDNRRAGLYGPTRVVIASWPDGAITGATDAPGFDPVAWPPPRLGPWPPPGLDGITRDALTATVGRFTAIWSRLITCFITGEDYHHRRDESVEGRMLLARLDPPPMTAVYASISPAFWSWLTGNEKRRNP
ncbi:MAG: hypothetical protein ACR2J8_12890 [Thermomicrobiales bacterium]